MAFQYVDYAVLCLLTALSAAIGFFFAWYKGGNKTPDQIFRADRNMPTLAIALSLVGIPISAATVLGAPARGYLDGAIYMEIAIGAAVANVLGAYTYLPILYNLGGLSVYKYFEMRFRKKIIRRIGTGTYIFLTLWYLSQVLYLPSVALSVVTGLNVWGLIFSLGLLCTLYTAAGGMKAVIWTDVFHVLLVIIGMTTILIIGSIKEGGFSQAWKYAAEGKRTQMINFDPDVRIRHTTWSLVLGAFFLKFSSFSVNQNSILQMLTASKLKNAQVALLLNSIGHIWIITVSTLIGVVIYAHYRECDPLKSGTISAGDQLLGLYVSRVLNYSAFQGFFVAVIFSASLSTVSSGLIAIAAVTYEDIVREHYTLTGLKATRTVQGLILGFGVLVLVLSILGSQLGTILQVIIGFYSVLQAPLFGMLTLGIFFKQANWKGSLVGWLTGLLFGLWLLIGSYVVAPSPIVAPPPRSIDGCVGEIPIQATANTNKTEDALADFYRVSYQWYAVFPVFITVLIGLPVSLLTGGDDQSKINPYLMINWREKFCLCRKRVDPFTQDQVEISDKNSQSNPTVKSSKDSNREDILEISESTDQQTKETHGTPWNHVTKVEQGGNEPTNDQEIITHSIPSNDVIKEEQRENEPTNDQEIITHSIPSNHVTEDEQDERNTSNNEETV